jgi:hypothetical protein
MPQWAIFLDPISTSMFLLTKIKGMPSLKVWLIIKHLPMSLTLYQASTRTMVLVTIIHRWVVLRTTLPQIFIRTEDQTWLAQESLVWIRDLQEMVNSSVSMALLRAAWQQIAAWWWALTEFPCLEMTSVRVKDGSVVLTAVAAARWVISHKLIN